MPAPTRTCSGAWRWRRRSRASSRCGPASTSRMPIRDNPVPTPAGDALPRLPGDARPHRGLHERLRLGTGILVLPHHNPVLLAKALASLDVLSGGRLIAGFGGGYVEPEFRAIGVDFHRRGAITDEHLAAIRALWTEREPRFTGRFASFADIRFEPKPVQRPASADRHRRRGAARAAPRGTRRRRLVRLRAHRRAHARDRRGAAAPAGARLGAPTSRSRSRSPPSSR